MTDIKALKENGERYFPQSHVQAIIGLESLNVNENGVFLVSENGKQWQLIVDDLGKLGTTEILEEGEKNEN